MAIKYQENLIKKLFMLIKNSEESNEAADKLGAYIGKFNFLLLHDVLNISEIFQLYMLEEPEGIDVIYDDDDTLIIKNKFDTVIVRSRSIEIK